MAAKLTRGAALKKLIDERPGVALAAAACGAWSGHVLHDYYSSWKSSKSSAGGKTLEDRLKETRVALAVEGIRLSFSKERAFYSKKEIELRSRLRTLEKEKAERLGDAGA